MGGVISLDFFLVPILEAILVLYDIVPFSRYIKYQSLIPGLLQLVIHRMVLEKNNLYRTPVKPIPDDKKAPTGPPSARSDDGFGTDWKNPTTAMEAAPIGRNMPALPRHLRNPHGKPDVQMIASRLLARESFKPAASQLNILAASWIQAMVHDWIGHFDGKKIEVLDQGLDDKGESLCPFAKSPFRFKNTKIEKMDGDFVSDSERTNWWDASFVYGNNTEQNNGARTKKGGKMITSDIPHALAERSDGTYLAGDNKNSWVGVALLQDLFIKEHNWICDQIAAEAKEEGRVMSDQELFDKARIIIAALVAKIHTVDWTVELLKTKLLEVGMITNWDGIVKGLFGISIFPGILSKMGEKKGKVSNNRGTPFCLTEEFAAVYRLHSLSPPGLILGDDKKEFVDLANLVGDRGRDEMRKSKTRPKKMMKSILSWPCGGLMPNNYPNAFRDVAPTNEEGKNLPESENIDLAALDLFRDRERGILKFNEFRRQLNLKPYRTWMELVGPGEESSARRLELIYGPGQEGIERLDLLVGDMYEGKVQPSFALSETSFLIFVLMASRRLDSDPFLNELYNEETYTKFGLKLVKENGGLFDLLDRHYPDLAKDFKDNNGKQKQSVFKPTISGDEWAKAIEDKIVPEQYTKVWAETKERNDLFFDELEAETEVYTKNLKANSKEVPVFNPNSIWTIISILLVVVPYYAMNTFVVPDFAIKPMFPADSIDIAKEFAFSNVRHNSSLNRILHLFTNPLIFVSQCFLLDQTPAVFGLKINLFGKELKVNAAFFYTMYLVIYSFLLDVYSGAFHLFYVLFFYRLVPDFGKWVTRVVGVKLTNTTAFVLYLFGQYIQVFFGHELEGFYNSNYYQIFIIQQLITVWNVMRALKVYPSLIAEVEIWEPIMKECMGKINFADCVA